MHNTPWNPQAGQAHRGLRLLQQYEVESCVSQDLQIVRRIQVMIRNPGPVIPRQDIGLT